jgi:hypothetical protein
MSSTEHLRTAETFLIEFAYQSQLVLPNRGVVLNFPNETQAAREDSKVQRDTTTNVEQFFKELPPSKGVNGR